MSEGLDWLYRPVLAGILPESALYDGSVDLARVSRLNEALDAQAENERRYHEAMAISRAGRR